MIRAAAFATLLAAALAGGDPSNEDEHNDPAVIVVVEDPPAAMPPLTNDCVKGNPDNSFVTLYGTQFEVSPAGFLCGDVPSGSVGRDQTHFGDHHHGDHHHDSEHDHDDDHHGQRAQEQVPACQGITGSAIMMVGPNPENSVEMCVMQGKEGNEGFGNGLICTGELDEELSADVFGLSQDEYTCQDGSTFRNGIYRVPRRGAHGLCGLVAIISLCALSGFLIVCKCVAPRQGFSTDLHGCFQDMGGCLLTMCCPCITYGSNAEFASAPHGSQHRGYLQCGLSWFWCLTYWCCHNFACCLGLAVRYQLRQKLRIEGTVTEDSCIHCFAHPCALCQERREIQASMDGGASNIGPVNGAATYTVQCPVGASAGMQVSVQTPQGLVQATVPQGVAAGEHFQIQCPAIPTVTATVVNPVPSKQAMHGTDMQTSLV